jgi:hypothetical protein
MGATPPAPGQPRWSEQDRLIAEAWFEYLDGLCPQCGHPRDEAWDIGNEFAWVGEVLHCWVCAAQDRAREKYLAQEGPSTAVEKHGIKTVARPRDG